MQFVTFTEDNGWEGEIWRFHLQVDGNEAELEKLRTVLAAEEAASPHELGYHLATETIPESEVDVLVKHSGSGYLPYENKVVGRFVFPEYERGDELEALYKGGIKDCFV
ncbi:hypothetical protein MOQ72_37255 [Saccharopolyspora sp. K220]|uniref:hypothetical protein n=1 Tax=Saccharopolyspora soli TaxID=2926618 RepID=UPI001F584B26|nr:hypothetical protein [Saccharopolyspora soli]MCI2423081.1 hypothetical protein [Saccharopolyspora soli]